MPDEKIRENFGPYTTSRNQTISGLPAYCRVVSGQNALGEPYLPQAVESRESILTPSVGNNFTNRHISGVVPRTKIRQSFGISARSETESRKTTGDVSIYIRY
ncbi:MAG: hypothetical protein Ct9H300mP16_06580 [Pseudomonadota bacterium]|nr:MAG: hypothetical protein Ct9H300mP16_06580 [Pseudomonadota bacterium]